MAEDELAKDEEEESFQLKSPISWEYIILEELRNINRLIIEAGRNFQKQNIFMLLGAIDSFEKDLKPLAELPENMKELNSANENIKESRTKLLKGWTIENYFEVINNVIEKKGAIIEILSRAGKYMPISTYLMEHARGTEGIIEEEMQAIME